MKSLSVVVFAAALSMLAGCAASAADTSETSSDAVTADADVTLEGAYKGNQGGEGASFIGIVFNTNGHFFADVDTGVRCIKAPCEGATARLSGTFKVSGHTVTLAPVANAFEEFYGAYNLTVSGDAISLSRAGSESAAALSGNLAKEISYCAQPTDCGSQNLVHPMCAPSSWTCGTENGCAFKCGN